MYDEKIRSLYFWGQFMAQDATGKAVGKFRGMPEGKFKDFLRSLYHRRMSLARTVEGDAPLVGIWRPDLNPTPPATALAMMGPSQGLDVICISTHDVDVKHGCVHGLRLKQGTDQWERVTMRTPDIIDVSSFCWKDREAREYLEGHCWCTDLKKNRISKGRLQTLLTKDDAVKKYAIPTLRYIKKGESQEEKLERLVAFMREHGDAVAKAVHSQRGVGVHRITFDSATGQYHIGYLTDEMDMDEEKFRVYAAEKFFSGKAHIIQKYVSSRSKTGDPFDCRVHVEKNGQGKWEPASMLVRIGIG